MKQDVRKKYAVVNVPVIPWIRLSGSYILIWNTSQSYQEFLRLYQDLLPRFYYQKQSSEALPIVMDKFSSNYSRIIPTRLLQDNLPWKKNYKSETFHELKLGCNNFTIVQMNSENENDNQFQRYAQRGTRLASMAIFTDTILESFQN